MERVYLYFEPRVSTLRALAFPSSSHRYQHHCHRRHFLQDSCASSLARKKPDLCSGRAGYRRWRVLYDQDVVVGVLAVDGAWVVAPRLFMLRSVWAHVRVAARWQRKGPSTHLVLSSDPVADNQFHITLSSQQVSCLPVHSACCVVQAQELAAS